MSTPSQLAIDTCNKMFSGPTAVPIQEALDQACAAKDQRIAELEAMVALLDKVGHVGYHLPNKARPDCIACQRDEMKDKP